MFCYSQDLEQYYENQKYSSHNFILRFELNFQFILKYAYRLIHL